MATLGTLEEWSKIKVKPGALRGLLLNKKGSWTAMTSGFSGFSTEQRERNTLLLPHQLCGKIVRESCLMRLEGVEFEDLLLLVRGGIN